MLVDIAFGGCTHFLDRRTKVMTLNVRMYVQASLTNIVHSMLSICDAGSVYPTFVERTEGSECLRFLKTEEHKNKSFI